MALSKTTQDRNEIRQWAESRRAVPAEVSSTERKGQAGILRFEFPGAKNANDSALNEISWEQFFRNPMQAGWRWSIRRRPPTDKRATSISWSIRRTRNQPQRSGLRGRLANQPPKKRLPKRAPQKRPQRRAARNHPAALLAGSNNPRPDDRFLIAGIKGP